ncbi:MAG: hypothetical protein WA775_03105 [Psychroserpens sp.]|uniref:hypothetical protein n=1 Tax=Psychroserpens sp. TaxID=2020870 RepID=UPI003CBCF191
MDRIINAAEGYPLSREWLNFFENQSVEAINGLVKAVGDNVIIAGLVEDNGVVSAGTIVYNGELLPFVASAQGATVVIVETEVSEGYDTTEDDSFSTILPVWARRIAKIGDPGDTGVVDSFALTSLKRIDNVRTLNENRLKFLKDGGFTVYFNPTNGVSSSANGEFTGITLNGSPTPQLTNLTLTFDDLPNTNYIVLFGAFDVVSVNGIHFWVTNRTINSIDVRFYVDTESDTNILVAPRITIIGV